MEITCFLCKVYLRKYLFVPVSPQSHTQTRNFIKDSNFCRELQIQFNFLIDLPDSLFPLVAQKPVFMAHIEVINPSFKNIESTEVHCISLVSFYNNIQEPYLEQSTRNPHKSRINKSAQNGR